MPGLAPPVLEVEDLRVWYPRAGDDRHVARAVDGVSFTLRRGSTHVLLGESGCGKTSLVEALIGLTPPAGRCQATAIRLHTDGEPVDLSSLDPDGEAMRRIRGGQIAMVFQDAAASLSPVRTVGSQLREVIRLHRGVTRPEADRLALELLTRVEVPEPEHRLGAYVHQLSGGLSQRVALALALAGEPQVLIADEPTTALDPVLQEQIVSLLDDLQRELDMAVLLVTHDLGVIQRVGDEVSVMYLGRIVETAPSSSIRSRPLHPYTVGLFESMPRLDERRHPLPVITGSSGVTGGSGCAFAPRCDHVEPRCREEMPALVTVEPGHAVRCVLHEPTPAPGR